MNQTEELVKLAKNGEGRVMIVASKIHLNGELIEKLPISMELEFSPGRIMLHTHASNSELKETDKLRYESVFKSENRSRVQISTQLADNAKVTIHFYDETPSLRESEERNHGEYTKEKFSVSYLEIEGDSALIANHFTVSEGFCGGPDDTAEAHAIIPGAIFRIRNSSSKNERFHPFHPSPLRSERYSSLIGKMGNYAYCIEQANEDVVFSVKTENLSQSPDPDLILESIMAAAGFVGGFQPWPFYRVTKKGDKITRHTLVATSSTQTFWHNPLSNDQSGDCTHHINMINHMADLLAASKAEAKALNRLIWIAKQPCRKNVPPEVQLLTACAVLEGLRKPYEKEYESGCTKSIEAIKKYGSSRETPWNMLKFRSMFEAADIPWEGLGARIYESWNKYRHALAHGFIPQKEQPTLDNYPETIACLVRMTYAIQLYLLRKANYTGPVRITDDRNVYVHHFLKPSNSLRLLEATPLSPDESP